MPSSSSSTRAKSSRKRCDEGAQLSFWEATKPAAESEPPRETRKRRDKPAAPRVSILDREVSGLVGNEILEGRLQPAEWAMALATSSGSREEAVTHYARIRLESLAGETEMRRQKREALESRRSSGFQKLQPETPVLVRGNQRRERVGLNAFWLGSMWLAVSGACASAVRLFMSDSQLFIANAGIVPHIMFGAALVCLAVALHFVIPRVRLALWQVLPVATCLAAFASFSFGVRILQQSIFTSDSTRPVASAPVLAPKSAGFDKSPAVGVPQSASKALVTAP